MEYKDVKTPKELLTYMDIINYGFVSKEGNIYSCNNIDLFEKYVTTKWFLSDKERLLKVKYGHCFDQVELERAWFEEHNYIVKTFYIMFVLPYENNYTTHTFLIYEKDNKYYHFEHADYYNRGIHEFNTLTEALDNEYNYHLNSNKKENSITSSEIKSLHIFEYNKPPFNISFNDFITYIIDNGKLIK